MFSLNITRQPSIVNDCTQGFADSWSPSNTFHDTIYRCMYSEYIDKLVSMFTFNSSTTSTNEQWILLNTNRDTVTLQSYWWETIHSTIPIRFNSSASMLFVCLFVFTWLIWVLLCLNWSIDLELNQTSHHDCCQNLSQRNYCFLYHAKQYPDQVEWIHCWIYIRGHNSKWTVSYL
jgi:hypothetical protein